MTDKAHARNSLIYQSLILNIQSQASREHIQQHQ